VALGPRPALPSTRRTVDSTGPGETAPADAGGFRPTTGNDWRGQSPVRRRKHCRRTVTVATMLGNKRFYRSSRMTVYGSHFDGRRRIGRSARWSQPRATRRWRRDEHPTLRDSTRRVRRFPRTPGTGGLRLQRRNPLGSTGKSTSPEPATRTSFRPTPRTPQRVSATNQPSASNCSVRRDRIRRGPNESANPR